MGSAVVVTKLFIRIHAKVDHSGYSVRECFSSSNQESEIFFFFFFEKILRQLLVSMKMAQQIILCSDLHIKIDLRRRWSLKHWSLIYKEKDLKVVGYFERKTLVKWLFFRPSIFGSARNSSLKSSFDGDCIWHANFSKVSTLMPREIHNVFIRTKL